MGALQQDAAAALNALASARARGLPKPVWPSRMPRGRELSKAQLSTWRRLGAVASATAPRPLEYDLCPSGALPELLKAKDLYDTDVPVAVAAYDPERVSVTSKRLEPKDARLLVNG